MSKKVDQRVVEIQFDNKDFESNVSKTMSTLDKLNDKLKMENAAKGLENVDKAAKNVDLSSVTNAAEDTGRSFSALEVMGVTALANITNAAVNAGKNLINNLISPITQGGLQRALNIEQAGFMLEGLGIENRNKAASSYDEIMNAVLGTAYSYDVAAKAASQLAASNIGVEESTVKMANGQKRTVKYLTGDMTNALLGIAGVASMTGSSFEEISDIFTNVAGKGKVGTEDLNRMASRGLNAFATLGDQLHKSEGEIRDMVTKGQIDFKTFSDAMSAAYGSHAKDSTKMFIGALEDTKAALARIGADFFGPVLNSARDALNAFTPFVDAIHDVFGSSNSGFIGAATNGIENLSNKLQTLLHVATYSMKSVGDSKNLAGSTAQAALDLIAKNEKVGKTSEELIHDIANATGKDFGQLKKDIESGKYALYELEDALQKTTKKGSEASKIFTSSVQSVREDKLWKLVKISDAMGLSVKANNEVIARFKSYKVDNILDIIGESLGKTGDEVQELIDNGTIGFDELNGILQDAVKNGALAQDVYDKATKKIRTDKIVQDNQELLSLVNNTFYLVDAIRAVGNAFKLLFGASIKLISPFINVIIAYGKIAFEITGAVLEGIAKIINKITELGNGSGDTLFKKLNNFTEKLIPSGKVISNIIDGIKKSFSDVLPIIDRIWAAGGRLFTSIADIARENILPKVSKAFGSMKGSFASLGNIIKDKGLFKTIFTGLADAFDHLSKTVPEIIRNFTNTKSFERIIATISKEVELINERFGEISKKFQNSKAGKAISNVLIKAVDMFTKLLDKFLNSKAVETIVTVVVDAVDTLRILLDLIGSLMDYGLEVFIEKVIGLIFDLYYLWNYFKVSLLDSEFFSAISSFLNGVLAKAFGILTTVLDKLSSAFSKITSNKSFIKIMDVIEKGITSITNSFNKLFGKLHIGKFFITLLDKASIAIDAIFDKISSGRGIDWLADAIGRLFENISNMFDQLANGDAVEHFDKTLSNILNTLEHLDKLSFDTFADRVVNFFTGGWAETGKHIADGLSKGLITGTSSVIEAIISIADNIITTFCDWLGIASPSKVFYTLGGFIIAGLLLGIKDSRGKAAVDIGDLAGRLAEAFVSAFEKLDPGALAVDALLGGALYTVVQLNKTAQMGLSPISNLGKAFKELTKVIKNLRLAFQLEINSLALVNLGLAIIMVAKSIDILSKIDSTKVNQVCNLMLTLVAVLGILAIIASKLGNGFGGMLTILSIAFAISSLAKTLEKLGDMDPDKIEQAMFPIIVLSTIVGVLTMISAGAGKAIKGVEKVIKTLSLVILSLAGFIVSIGAAFVLIGLAMQMIALIPETKFGQVEAILLTVGSILGVLLAIALEYNTEIKGISKFFLSIGLMFIGIALAMQMIALIRGDKVWTSIGVIAGLFVAVAGLMWWATKLAKDKDKIADFGNLFLGIAAMFISMSLSIKILSGIKDGMGKALLCLGVLTAFIAALMYATNLLYGGGDNVAEFGTMMVGIAKSLLIMSAAIALLSILDTGSMFVAGVVIAGLLAVIALVVKNASNVENAKGTVMWMAVIVGALAASLFILSQMDLAKLLASTGSLLLLMWSIYAIFGLINQMDINQGMLTKVGFMALILAEAVAAIAILAHFTDADDALKIAEAIALVMGVLAVACLAIGAAGMAAEVAWPGLIVVGVVLAAVCALIAYIADNAERVNNVLDKALPVFLKFADGIGEFFGRIVSKFINTKSEGTAQALTNFAKTIEPLGESADKISKFSNALEPIKDITKLITGNIAQKLTDFGRGLKDMVGKITNIDDSDISSTKEKLSGVADSLGGLGGSIKKQTAKTTKEVSNSGKEIVNSFMGSFNSSDVTSKLDGNVGGMLNKLTSGIDSEKGKMPGIGKNYGLGFANGIVDKDVVSKVTSNSYRLAKIPTNITSRWGIVRSPSRRMMKIGGYYGEGFAIGIDKSSYAVEKASYNLATNTTDSIRGVMSKIDDILGEGIDMTPVITPVLDTSEVNSSFGRLNSMFSNTKALNVSADVNSRTSKFDVLQNALGSIKDGIIGNLGQNGNTYVVNGITYDDGSNITNAIETLVKATVVEGRI